MKILLADDDSSVRRIIQFKLEKKGYDVVAVTDGREALDSIRVNAFDLLLTDIRMPRLDGIALLERAKNIQPELKVILITAHADVSQAVRAVKLGAFDYLTKPFDDDELFVAIEKALAFRQLEKENVYLKERLKEEGSAQKAIGISKAFKDVLAMVKKIAGTDATVLLTGESGTGKELIARLIHEQSHRSQGGFVAVNCAAIPKDLLESELFGHVKGAFTGAIKDKKGKFELASGGTLLLDEIGDLAIDLQAKLLRVIQEQAVEPVGAETKREIDLRLIAATNVNLAERVAAGTFREDLFYRLNVIPIHVPSLRERPEDIPVLVKAFVKRFAGDETVTVVDDCMRRLTAYRWPGNIRELENLIERMIILRQSNELTFADLPDNFKQHHQPTDDSTVSDKHISYREAEKKLIIDALNACGWNRTRAAKYIDIPRHVLIYRMKKYGISEPV